MRCDADANSRSSDSTKQSESSIAKNEKEMKKKNKWKKSTAPSAESNSFHLFFFLSFFFLSFRFRLFLLLLLLHERWVPSISRSFRSICSILYTLCHTYLFILSFHSFAFGFSLCRWAISCVSRFDALNIFRVVRIKLNECAAPPKRSWMSAKENESVRCEAFGSVTRRISIF